MGSLRLWLGSHVTVSGVLSQRKKERKKNNNSYKKNPWQKDKKKNSSSSFCKPMPELNTNGSMCVYKYHFFLSAAKMTRIFDHQLQPPHPWDTYEQFVKWKLRCQRVCAPRASDLARHQFFGSEGSYTLHAQSRVVVCLDNIAKSVSQTVG